MPNPFDYATLPALLDRAIFQRKPLIDPRRTDAFRVFSGQADRLDGLFIDVYGPGATLILYEGVAPAGLDADVAAETVLEGLRPLGVKAIYVKPFARDRSRLGGNLPACVTDPTPAAGEPLPESILIREGRAQLEIRLFDGLSTGLFLDQRENRAFLAEWVARRTRSGPPAVLNTFAYTCAFSVATALAGASTTSVDVSARYLDWGRRNFAHNGLDANAHRFARMDTFEFFAYARRKSLRYDLIILDPPSFASGSKKRGTKPWSSLTDYPRLVSEAAGLLNRGGTIFASTNTMELCRPGRLEQAIRRGLGRMPRWVELPEAPVDFARDADRFSACAFTV